MAWEDKPTNAQLDALFYWFKWVMPSAKASNAVKWLGDHSNRKEVSDEMSRIRELKRSRRLNQNECFNSTLWDDYLFKESEVN